MNEASQLLRGLKVVDLGQGMAPALVAKLLADAGADVARIAPAGDDAFAAIYKAYPVWHARSRLCTESDLAALLQHADICLLGGEDHPDVTPFSGAIAEQDYPRLVIIRIDGSPPGMDGAGRPSTEILAQGLSGLAFEQFPDRPLAMAFAPANNGAAFQALIGGLTALYEREGSGLGQTVRTSLVEGAISWLPMFWARFEKPTPAASFIAPKDALPLIFRCKDGKFLHLVIGAAGSKYKLYQVLGVDDPDVKPGDSGMPRPGGDPRNFYGDIDVIAAHCARWNRQELLEQLWEQGLAAEPVLAPGALWDDPQIQRNELIRRDADGTRSIGLPFLARRSAAPEPRTLPAGARPLEGIRVLDFGAYVAGPLASQLLTGLGADVIKIEPPAGEPSRGLIRGYLAANRGKRGITLDMKTDAGRAAARALSLSAHVVTSNFRTGVSARLGIDAQTLIREQPDLVILESPAYGTEGPYALRAGFDMVMQAVSGLEQRGGTDARRGEAGHPLWNRLSMVDFAAGTLGAISLLCALYLRRRDGTGSVLEMPLVNAGLYLLSELIQTPDGHFVGAEPVDDSGGGFGPLEAFYPVRDGWIAISARGGHGADTLARLLDLQEVTRSAIAASLAVRDREDAVATLRGGGIWAESCHADGEARLFAGTDLPDHLVRETRHAVLGQVRDLGMCFSMSRSILGNDIPLHGVGEHNSEIL